MADCRPSWLSLGYLQWPEYAYEAPMHLLPAVVSRLRHCYAIGLLECSVLNLLMKRVRTQSAVAFRQHTAAS